MDLWIDIETFSDVDLTKAGLYRYAQSPAFRVLLFAYSIDGGPVQIIDTTQDELPYNIQRLLTNSMCTKHAYNASFEWYCLSRHLGLSDSDTAEWIPQWRDTQLQALYCGYPASLDAAGRALGLGQDKQKMSVGKALIRYFSIPCRPTKVNGGRTRNLPSHDPAKWDLFKDYCKRDVETEMEIDRLLERFPVPEEVQKQWETDLKINLRGVAVDMDLVRGALAIDVETRNALIGEAREITGADNPNSIVQLLTWLEPEVGYAVTSLTKATVKDMLAGDLPSDKARRMLEIRQELGKTSVKKYAALETATCDDGRVRGILQFYGANRTGRWAGRIVQPQNLPRTYIPGELLPTARELVKARCAGGLRWLLGSVPDALSQLIRTALVASPAHILIDADFSAIEARVLAWLAGETWRLDVFRTHGKIYEASASQMFGVPMEKIKKGNPEYELRQRGKVAELALGYGGGVAAMRQMDTGKILADVPDEDIQDMVRSWRLKSPRITRLWSRVEDAAFQAIGTGTPTRLWLGDDKEYLIVAYEKDTQTDLDFMTIQLPSGRKLFYPHPHIGMNRFGHDSVCYMGVNQTSRKWEPTETYGGKLVENITQAVARDCLAEAVERLEAAGFPVVFHVHDEVVIDVEQQYEDLDKVTDIMRENPSWAQSLPLNADGWVDAYYKKD